MKITRDTGSEEQVITVKRIGRAVVVMTERASIARSVARQVEEAIAPRDVRVVGFSPEED